MYLDTGHRQNTYRRFFPAPYLLLLDPLPRLLLYGMRRQRGRDHDFEAPPRDLPVLLVTSKHVG
jgi:hypothetical protein